MDIIPPIPRTTRFSPLKISIIYIVVGGVWILFSDLALAALVQDPVMLTHMQTFKGWFFVSATAAMLYLLIRRDVQSMQRAERALQESITVLKALVRSSPLAIFMLDLNGEIRMWNPAAERIFGWSEKEVIGKPSPIVPEHDREQLLEMRRRVLAGEVFTGLEVRRKRKDGSLIHVSLSTASLHDAAGTAMGTIVLASDITNQRRLEQQLFQSQKMEAIGQLASGIAHDFNNILTAIISYESILEMMVPHGDPARGHIEQIRALADRAANLTQNLLAFSRRQAIHPRPADLNGIIKGSAGLLSGLIGKHIEFELKLSGTPLDIMADSGQLEQVMMNLATNARDAMPGGGLLIIRTEQALLDAGFVQHHGYGEPGRYALITVSDTGVGMDNETKRKIFEPFFTTKEVGKGTGLGLSIVYGIVKQHGGFINVYSEPGKGSTFKIYLPLITPPAGEKEEPPAEMPPGGTETILLAEDEPELRRTTKSFLEKFGYTVIEAADGEDAFEKFLENKDTVRLLILDAIMPNREGEAVYKAAREVRPDVRALFTSGHSVDIMHKRRVLDGAFDFISKPFSPGDLLRKLREVLDR